MGKSIKSFIRLLLIVALASGAGAFFLGVGSHASPSATELSALHEGQTDNPLANTIRVAPSGSNDSGCGSEAAPCQTIQYAVNKAAPGDTILVAEGTYTFNASEDVCSGPTGTTGVVCVINTDLTILGGYSTSNWTTSNPSANPTIIDGEHTYRGVHIPGPTTSLRMEGFTIQNGLATGIPIRSGNDAIYAYGGGVFVDFGGQPVPGNKIIFRHLVFKNNLSKGENHNPSGGSGIGGGLSLRGVANPILEHLTFENNQAWGGEGSQRGGYGLGGAVHVLFSSGVVFSDIVMTNNIARGGWSPGSGRDGGELSDGLGGGIAAHADIELRNMVASGNQAKGGNASDQAGAGVGGAVFAEYESLAIYDSIIHDNTVLGGDATDGGWGNGGGIDLHNASLLMERTLIYSNTAKGGNSTGGGKSGQPGGGGVFAACFSGGCSFDIKNSVIADNAVQHGGGDLSIGGGGGGLWLQGIYGGKITHTTIARNRLESTYLLGMGLLLVDFVSAQPSSIDFKYNIIASHSDDYGNNTGTVFVLTNNTATLDYTLWADNDGKFNTWSQGTIVDNHPISASAPGFVSPGSPNYDYHILGTSAAKDQATGSTLPDDMDGEARPFGQLADIGADEYSVSLALDQPWPGNGTLTLNWTPSSSLAANVDHYELIVSCESGASAPVEGACDAPIDVGDQTSFTLTGLTNGKTYTITVKARDASGQELAADTKTGIPLDFQYTIFVPLVSKSY